MEEKELTPQESMALIQSMIGKARKRYSDNSFFFLLWGWIVLVASVGHYYLSTFTDFEYPFIGWSLTIVGAIVSGVVGARRGKKSQVKNYTDKMYAWLWFSLGMAMFTIVFNGQLIGWNTVPFILLLAGVGTAVSGAMMGFRPLQIGGLVFWILAFIAFRQPENYQMLILAGGIAIGYLVPGYIMKANFRKHGV
ncbi:hypothetical protein OB69_04325 [Roseivirga seohaensis subsp. aquiponti]|uniref:Transmembrane protein n=1 Tax=Roseivirga seohaensis subsp. aquiponti TaxID=1566026 RepID=A0A0L8AMT5_9BACT|nr:hypothetical protein [Roseivirga seohaensis]KOF03793.1 hypothetical protein OB69_04325 [Roseivirga seohaensis subsp. aquiponti]